MEWMIPGEMNAAELDVAKHLKRVGKFYVFLRQSLPSLFSEAFIAELDLAYHPRGEKPLPPALLATVTLLQAYDQVSDSEAVVTSKLDRRWQLVLGTLDWKEAAFSQGSLPNFRRRMVEHELDKKLLSRTVELAKDSGAFGWRQLKATFDSSALVGTGRVEDTWNLLGRAIRHLVQSAAHALKVPPQQVAKKAGVTILGELSLKALLDIDWDDREARAEALKRPVKEATALESWVVKHLEAKADVPPISLVRTDLKSLFEQDLEPDPSGAGLKLRRGVSRDRMPSLGD